MSRIGKKIIHIPNNLSISLKNGKISISTNKNSIIEHSLLPCITINKIDSSLVISRNDDSKKSKSYHGLMRTLIQNSILGLMKNFQKNLIIEGVGYKFQINNKILFVHAGYTHSVELEIPEEIFIELENPTKLKLFGTNKEKVGLFAAQIRKIKPPEPYKGKGIRYENEIIKRKIGKTGK